MYAYEQLLQTQSLLRYHFGSARNASSDPDVVNTLVWAGQLDLLIWLHHNVCSGMKNQSCLNATEDAAAIAASTGQLHVLQWLVEYAGVQVGEKVCAYAYAESNLECLRYARNNGAQFEEEEMLNPDGEARREALQRRKQAQRRRYQAI